MNTQQRISNAKQRIKELELLIHHWQKTLPEEAAVTVISNHQTDVGYRFPTKEELKNEKQKQVREKGAMP